MVLIKQNPYFSSIRPLDGVGGKCDVPIKVTIKASRPTKVSIESQTIMVMMTCISLSILRKWLSVKI